MEIHACFRNATSDTTTPDHGPFSLAAEAQSLSQIEAILRTTVVDARSYGQGYADMWFVTAPIEVISKTHRLSDTFVFCFFFTTLASAVTRSMSTVEKGHRFFPQHPPSLSGSLQLQVPVRSSIGSKL